MVVKLLLNYKLLCSLHWNEVCSLTYTCYANRGERVLAASGDLPVGTTF
jgi:hypothetical protein